MSSKRMCYYANESFYDSTRGYVVAVVNEGEPGYRTLAGGYLFADEAKEEADRLNEKAGLSRDDVLDIVASSMRAGKVQR
ncbi:hypothetical protein SEA_IPHANE7_136 [Mycobacterium phage IPhane7]|uniref:Uncharacterized protein n=2 Tax=Bongovirus bongo TaxID=1983750 RepID=A0A385D300_9CAUD|nr:hypothetical protein SEA_IPHANE7_136 [Mycobacterium phage IPhane7]QGJ93261.1 hypothetical protein SEA_TYDAWG_133 [Mycobacterium phage TyDawg]WNM75330.1 hypothetical protein SEA_AUSPICE_139 [Mycobacterium phage Auspice]